MKAAHPIWRIVCAAVLLLAGTAARADTPELIDRIKPSIVAIGIFSKMSVPAFTYRGTGFAIDDGRRVATNAHVLPETLDAPGTSLAAQLRGPDGELQLRMARVQAKDPLHDLAILSIEGPALPALQLRNSDGVREGQTVLFTGYPIGGVLGFSPATHRGMISAIPPVALPSVTSRQLDEKLLRRLRSENFRFFQLDATAYPGSSGSPVFDPESGKVIAVLSGGVVKRTHEAALSNPSGISYAIPANHLADLLGASPRP